jgi:catechol 2,3-dioxygenase-like lactoylglutathione lyase family enzyme
MRPDAGPVQRAGGLAGARLVAFVATSDLERATAFYEGVLGLPVVERDAFACVVEGGGTRLRLTLTADVQPAPYTVLGWEVDELTAAVRALTDRGVRFERFDRMEQDGAGVWVAPSGARVAWFKDPDGNVLSLTQLR